MAFLIPFLKTNGASTDLVKDYDFKSHYPDVNMNTPWANIAPYLRQSVRTYVLPYIGAELYNDICTKIQDGDTLTDEQNDFAELLKDVVAHYAIMAMLPKKKTIIASMGAVGNQATEGTTTSVIWEYKTTLWAVVQDADRMMDELLAYLQEQVEDGTSYFVTNWKETPAHDSISAGLFRQVSDFQKYYNINNSLRTFKSLVPLMDEVAERVIVPIISQNQYDRLIEAVKEGDATTEEARLLHLVRKVLAKNTVYEAAVGLPILAERDGFRVISNTDAVDQRAYDSAIITTAIQGIREQSERAGNTAKADLVDFLYTNKADFPLWEASNSNRLNEQYDIYPIITHGNGGVML